MKTSSLILIQKLSQWNQPYRRLKQTASYSTTACAIQVSNRPLISFQMIAPYIHFLAIPQRISSLSSSVQMYLQLSGKPFTERGAESPGSFSEHPESRSRLSPPACPCWSHTSIKQKAAKFLYPRHPLVQIYFNSKSQVTESSYGIHGSVRPLLEYTGLCFSELIMC